MTAFGQAVASSGSSTDPYGFAATSRYRNDGDGGLMLVGARYYDAQIGMFISRDTDLSQLPYGYCDGDPVNAVDPDGHLPKWIKAFLKWISGGGGPGIDATDDTTTIQEGGGTIEYDYPNGKKTKFTVPPTIIHRNVHKLSVHL